MAGHSPAHCRPKAQTAGSPRHDSGAAPVPGRVAVVGPCAAGKSVLVARLREAGYDAWQPAQEHSYVPDMWRRLANPEALICLDVSLSTLLARRHTTDFTQDHLEEQHRRLEHARAHCDLHLSTDDLTERQVFDRVVRALDAMGIVPTCRSAAREPPCSSPHR